MKTVHPVGYGLGIDYDKTKVRWSMQTTDLKLEVVMGRDELIRWATAMLNYAEELKR